MKILLADLKLFLILVAISATFFVLDLIHWLTIPKSLLQQVTTPIQYGVFYSGTSFFKQFEFIYYARQAVNENRAIKKQLAEVLLENAAIQKKLQETQSQVDQNITLPPQTFNLVPARPIGLGRYLIIDKGSQDEVSIGDIIVFKNNYIGQVKQVTPKTSQVLLAQDPDSKIAVFSQHIGESGQSEGRAKGILQGEFGSESLMDKILHQEAIGEGDIVYSEGSEGKLARGLVVGKVMKVLERPNEVFKQAKVSPVFQVIDLDLVYILKN